jgi:thioredoxin reductase
MSLGCRILGSGPAGRRAAIHSVRRKVSALVLGRDRHNASATASKTTAGCSTPPVKNRNAIGSLNAVKKMTYQDRLIALLFRHQSSLRI